MPGQPWTKFQDFYLRLGFLKVLVGALSPQRRSAANDSIIRRVQKPLLAPAKAISAELFGDVLARLPATTLPKDADKRLTVAEALLIVSDSPSWLYGITYDTAYKILDWGHNVGFVGAGNQITERGLLLRQLIPDDRVQRFFAGDARAWNPFILSHLERVFLLYHLSDIDQVTAALIGRLGERDASGVLEAADAGEVTCRVLFQVLERARPTLLPRDLPRFRAARELACTIARELGLSDLLRDCTGLSPRVPKPRTPLAAASARRTTKNADHQAIPRFEQLVDLGFIVKPAGGSDAPSSFKMLSARRWRYEPTERCRLWRDSMLASRDDRNWLWTGFAAAAVRCELGGVEAKAEPPTPSGLVRFIAMAYDRVHRPIGHTPLESVALVAMMLAADEGYVLEMATVHELLLALKKRSLLPDHVFFASGNDLDKMFVLLRPGFDSKLLEIYEQLRLPAAS
jgi:hypothetical protein